MRLELSFGTAGLLAGLLATMTAAAAPARPDPYRLQEAPFIGPAPTPVMEQVFWVQLARAPGAPVQADVPPGVRLLDQTRPGAGRAVTRLYFRSDRGIRDGVLTLRLPDAAPPVTVPLRVLTYREDLEDKVADTPQLDRQARKQGRSWYTPERVRVALENLERDPSLGDRLRVVSRFDGLDDEAVFQWLPSWNLPRQCYSTWPCPHCGEAIYAKNAFYPWVPSRAQRFKAACPLCAAEFPSNDITKDDFCSGDTPDDGWGHDATDGRDRKSLAGWVALYNHHSIWQSTGSEMLRLAERHILLGDAKAAHQVGVLLARLAYIYPGMDMTWQQVQANYLRPGRLLVDGNWERTGVTVLAAQAYDAIFDHLDQDWELVRFLQRKDDAIQSPADVKALIDTYLIQIFGWDWVNNRLSGGNQGARERDAAALAVCAYNGAPADAWIEKMFTASYNSGLNRGGFDDEMLVNTLTREGITLINGFHYALGYLSAKSGLAEVLSRLPSERWRARADLYDLRQYPKLRAEYDAWPEMLVAGNHQPCYGDDGSARGARLPKGPAAVRRYEYSRAYARWPTDALARAVVQAGAGPVELLEPDVRAAAQAQVERCGPAAPLQSRVLDGVGFAFLESRYDAEKPEQRAGVAFRYGYGAGHNHHDTLNLEFWAHNTALVPELGYPCWAHPLGATGHVAHHITGMIDRAPQYRGATARGTLEGFANAPEASFAEASAQPDGFPNRVYRRAVCLADAPGGRVYLIDILRLAGGTRRTYCFHGPAHRAFESSLTFGAPQAEPFPVDGMHRGLQNNLLEPQAAASDATVWADWHHDLSDVHLRLHLLGQAGRAYTTSRYGKPDAPPVRFLFAEDEAADGASEFVALWEPWTGKPFLGSVERLPVTASGSQDGAPGEFAPVALRVDCGEGQVDTFFYSMDPTATLQSGEFTFQGRFGYWSERDGALRCLHLVDGATLRKGDRGVRQAAPARRLRLTGIDLAETILTLDGDLPVGTALQGQMLFLQGGPHRTAWRIAEVLPPGNRVRLECSSLIFRSRLDGVDEAGTTLTTELAPPIELTRGIKAGYYDGALVTDEARKARFRVAAVRDGKVILDRPCRQEDFADADGDGRRMVAIYDHGEGDEAVLYRSVFLRVEDGVARVHGEATLEGLPAAAAPAP